LEFRKYGYKKYKSKRRGIERMDNNLKNWNHENWINFFVKAFKKIDRSYEDIYFNIFSNTSGKKERIFCYKLYHPMRIIQEFFEYDLDFGKIEGERDKRDEQQKKFKKILDFMVHKPGSNNNYLVVEVKKASSKPKGIENDLIKLKSFMDLSPNGLNYKYGIFFIFGNGEMSSKQKNIDLTRLNKRFQNRFLVIIRNNYITHLITENRFIILWCHDESAKDSLMEVDGRNLGWANWKIHKARSG